MVEFIRKGGHLIGQYTPVVEVLRYFGWEPYTTFYVPDITLIVLVLTSLARPQSRRGSGPGRDNRWSTRQPPHRGPAHGFAPEESSPRYAIDRALVPLLSLGLITGLAAYGVGLMVWPWEALIRISAQ